MEKAYKVLNSLLNMVIIVTVTSMVALVFLNVVLRYAFNSGLTWSEELARYLFVWVVFLGAIIAAKEKGHLGVDLLVSALPAKLQKVTYAFANIVFIGALVLLIDGLIKMMELNSMIKGPATGIPINILYLAGLISAVCMIGILIIQTIRFVFYNRDAPAWAKGREEGQS